jgi:hypothetical protein
MKDERVVPNGFDEAFLPKRFLIQAPSEGSGFMTANQLQKFPFRPLFFEKTKGSAFFLR